MEVRATQKRQVAAFKTKPALCQLLTQQHNALPKHHWPATTSLVCLQTNNPKPNNPMMSHILQICTTARFDTVCLGDRAPATQCVHLVRKYHAFASTAVLRLAASALLTHHLWPESIAAVLARFAAIRPNQRRCRGNNQQATQKQQDRSKQGQYSQMNRSMEPFEAAGAAVGGLIVWTQAVVQTNALFACSTAARSCSIMILMFPLAGCAGWALHDPGAHWGGRAGLSLQGAGQWDRAAAGFEDQYPACVQAACGCGP